MADDAAATPFSLRHTLLFADALIAMPA
jgi:hypothetical protein